MSLKVPDGTVLHDQTRGSASCCRSPRRSSTTTAMGGDGSGHPASASTRSGARAPTISQILAAEALERPGQLVRRPARSLHVPQQIRAHLRRARVIGERGMKRRPLKSASLSRRAAQGRGVAGVEGVDHRLADARRGWASPPCSGAGSSTPVGVQGSRPRRTRTRSASAATRWRPSLARMTVRSQFGA
jgi:hypothetical protein